MVRAYYCLMYWRDIVNACILPCDEQSRIVGRNKDERSFHIFYQIHHSDASNMREFHINTTTTVSYLNPFTNNHIIDGQPGD